MDKFPVMILVRPDDAFDVVRFKSSKEPGGEQFWKSIEENCGPGKRWVRGQGGYCYDVADVTEIPQ